MSNHSAEYPNGILDKETLKSFFAITEASDGTLTWQPGYERIPDNWYRRPLGAVNEYSPVSFAQDLLQIAAVVPEAVSVGGNTGTVNSFAGADLGNITGGAYQTSDLTNPTKFVCFFYQLTLAIVPDFLRSEALGNALAGALNLLQSEISPFVNPSCAKIGELFYPFVQRGGVGVRLTGHVSNQQTTTTPSQHSFPALLWGSLDGLDQFLSAAMMG